MDEEADMRRRDLEEIAKERQRNIDEMKKLEDRERYLSSARLKYYFGEVCGAIVGIFGITQYDESPVLSGAVGAIGLLTYGIARRLNNHVLRIKGNVDRRLEDLEKKLGYIHENHKF